MSGRIWQLQIPEQPVRGAYVSLGQDWPSLVAQRAYTQAAASLLGQCLLALPMMAAHLKVPSRLSLQISQAGPLNLLAAQTTGDGAIRGLIKVEDAFNPAAVRGQMAVTLEPENSREQFQGIVALEGESPAIWLRNYFEQSEQVTTRLVLCADEQQAAGLLLQSVPGQSASIDWAQQVDALDVDMLPAEPGEWLSTMLGMDLRVSEEAEALRIHCPCDSKSVARMLTGLGWPELDSILNERGNIDIECGFCGESYRYDRQAVQVLFDDEPDQPSLH